MSPMNTLVDGLLILFFLGIVASFSGLIYETLRKAMPTWRSRRQKLVNQPQKHGLGRP
jgi:hypothetical protein